MKRAILFLALFFSAFSYTQNQQDSVLLNDWDAASIIYDGLNSKSNFGMLFNRMNMDSIDAMVYASSMFDSDTNFVANADLFYRLMYELKLMSTDTSSVIGLKALYDTTSQYIGKQEFETDRLIVPIGIADYKFEAIDIARGVNENKILSTDSNFIDISIGDFSLNITHNCRLAAPLFYGFGSDIMGVVLRSNQFFSNYRETSDIIQISININGQSYQPNFNEIVEFAPEPDSMQYLSITVGYSDGTSFTNYSTIFTPDLYLKDSAKSGGDFPKCYNEDTYNISGNKLKYCFIPRCFVDTPRDNFDYDNHVPQKPYILIAGYRPPIFGQSYKKTWKIYTEDHNGLLRTIRNENHDIYIVKFNIQWKPYAHGMQESAALLEDFLLDLNKKKHGGLPFENVIQANSMGCDIARLTLLTMEKKHRENNNYPHHHTRSVINYDGNFYGANIPLAYQYQFLSGFYYPLVQLNIPVVNQIKFFLRTFLYATEQQKTVKELLQYHALGSTTNGLLFISPIKTEDVKPGIHQKRQDYYNALAAVDNGEFFIPMPNTTRNVAISLGRLSGTNTTSSSFNNNYPDRFQTLNDPWRDQNFLIYRSLLQPGFGDLSGNYQKLFHRRKIKITIKPPFFLGCKHITNVKEMYAVDNSAGSYLNSFGNLISVTDWTYFTLQNLVNGRNYFTHKPVVSALAINPNLWQNNGSMSLDLQVLKLMYTSQANLIDLNQSNFYGYSNLGNPTNYLDITPFEAIYCDRIIDPHIKLQNADNVEREATTSFILNEIEPNYLGLQNRVFGSKMRSNYNYYSRRRARNIIYIGKEVTPTTGVGDYVVLNNIELFIQAGEEVVVADGTYFTSGSDVTLQAGYFFECSNPKSASFNEEVNNTTQNSADLIQPNIFKEENTVIIYPNPSNGVITLASSQLLPLHKVKFYSLSGVLMQEINLDNRLRKQVTVNFKAGTYVVKVELSNGKLEAHKIIIQ